MSRRVRGPPPQRVPESKTESRSESVNRNVERARSEFSSGVRPRGSRWARVCPRAR